MIDLAEVTARLWANKEAKGFNTTSIDREFNFAYAELAEAFEAYRNGDKAEFGKELADVMLFVLSLAKFQGVDMEAEIRAKLERNEQRQYIKRGDFNLDKDKLGKENK